MDAVELPEEDEVAAFAEEAKTSPAGKPSKAMVLLRQGNKKGAVDLCRRVLFKNPGDGEAHNVLGLIAGMEGRNEEALGSFQRALECERREAYLGNFATALARAERWSEAESHYREALTLNPTSGAVRRKLGAVLERTGRSEEAIALYRTGAQGELATAQDFFVLGSALYAQRRHEESLVADRAGVALDPRSVSAHTRIAGALRSLGRLNDALAAFEEARALDPENWATHANVGSLLRDLRRFDEAVSAYRQAVALAPQSALCARSLGICLLQADKVEEAVTVLRRASMLEPDYEGLGYLGQALWKLGDLDAAAAALRRALELRPGDAKAHHKFGDALRKMAKLDEACLIFRVSIVLDGQQAEPYHGLALALRGLARFRESREAFEKALELAPASAEIWNNYANVVREFGLLEEACVAYRKALEINPDYPEALTNLATALKDQGNLDEAVENYERALAINPDLQAAHGNLLFAQSYRRGTTLAGLAVAHRAWNDRFARPMKANWPVFKGRNRPTPRLGFVSADFNNHPVGYFTIRVFEELRRRGAELVFYANQTREDALTSRFRATGAPWRSIAGLSDAVAAKRIQSDEIDVLFDMSGFMAGNRLGIFALKPAPVQVTWFGYMATTGLEAIDYILADRHHIPVESERYYSEKVIRLPHSLVCFDPPADAAPVGPLPARANGHVTFGSFNVLCKITAQVVEVWSKILLQVPNSKLLLKTAAFSCPDTRARYAAMFASHGVSGQRLMFEGRTSRTTHMESTAKVDIALDPFPYVGCTTTVECVYMGVPVITWPGQLFSSRHSLSMLTTIGATETVVGGLKQYEEVAVDLAQDISRLEKMRASLRGKLLSSPLCDAAAFTSDFEQACRTMWNAFQNANERRDRG